MKGECNCGEVQFYLTPITPQIYVCHCSICRKATGSANIPIVIAANEQFHWTRGEASLKTWRKPTGDWLNTFCRHCGSPMPRPNCELTMAVPAGAITEGAESLVIAHHIFVESRVVWEEICDGAKQHSGAFEAG